MIKKAPSTRKADDEEEIKLHTPELKFELIKHTIMKYEWKRMVSYCVK